MNERKKSLLFITKAQFGYQTDYLKYCQFLKDSFDITYVCFDSGYKKLNEQNINIIYVDPTGSFLKNGISFFNFNKKIIQDNNFDLVFLVYFQSASLLQLILPHQNFNLDIRSGKISSSYFQRLFYNRLMLLESLFFENVSIISISLAKQLKLNLSKVHALPLGADVLSTKNKLFEVLKLMYVGTLNSRNIQDTILGLNLFLKESKISTKKISYDIFGSGSEEEENLIHNTIKEFNLSEIVKYHGAKTHEELYYYFDICNIGVSYIPKTVYFNCQPPTKTYEYINAGLLCIATSTDENKKLIDNNNGVLCEDTPLDFSRALSKIYEEKSNYNSTIIRHTLIKYSWKNIVDLNLRNYLKSILNIN